MPADKLTCQVSAHPPATRFLWSFVPLGALPESRDSILQQRVGPHERLEEPKVAPGASHVQTLGPELADVASLVGEGGPQQRGLVLCWALNALGWQRAPCLILVAPRGLYPCERVRANGGAEPILVKVVVV